MKFNTFVGKSFEAARTRKTKDNQGCERHSLSGGLIENVNYHNGLLMRKIPKNPQNNKKSSKTNYSKRHFTAYWFLILKWNSNTNRNNMKRNSLLYA